MISIRTIILVTLIVYVGAMFYIISQSTGGKRTEGANLYAEYEIIKQKEKSAERRNPNRHQHESDERVNDFESPVVVTGTGGTGTRVASDILEHAGGVFMGLQRNAQRDSSTFDQLVKRYVDDVLVHTEGNMVYEVEDLPSDLVERIRNGVSQFAQIMERDAKANSKSGRWGWKESQSMFFLPFLYEKWPHMRLVHVVRDGRDMAFSKQQRATFQEGYVRAVTKTTAPLSSPEYAKAVIKTWQKINRSVAKWMDQNQSARYFVIRLEDMCGPNSRDYASKLLNEVLGDQAADPEKTVNTGECRIGKYKTQDPALVRELEEIAFIGLNFFDYHMEKQDHDHDTDSSGENAVRGPVVVTGTAGTGTRVANDILEHAGGVFMGGERNFQRDSTVFDIHVKRFVPDVLKATQGSLDYEISDLPRKLVDDIRRGINNVDNIMREARGDRKGWWGWKESQSMFFLPFLYEKWPDIRMVHVVRDGRDIAFSAQQRAMYQEIYVRQVTKTKADMKSDEYAKAVITTWQKINLSATKWLEDHVKPSGYMVVRLEDMCGDHKHTVADKMLTQMLGQSGRSDPAKTVSANQCRLGKYKDRDAALVSELEQIAEEALTKFGFLESKLRVNKPDPTPPVSWQHLSFPDLVHLQASKAGTGRQEVVLLASDSSYKSVFLNWLILANHHNVRNFLMIALNEDMHQFCKEIGFPSYYFRSTLNVGQIWLARVKIIVQILELGVGVHMADTDAFFVQNPYPLMHPELYDIEALPGDFPWSVSWPTGKIGTVNGGFVRINSNPITVAFMNAVHAHMLKSHISDDQHSLNHLLDDMGIKWTEQPGCLHSYGLCHVGVTTKNQLFDTVKKDAALTVRLLDKPHFPVLASWKRFECNRKFFMLRNASVPQEAFYYTPVVIHPAGSEKAGKAKIQIFRNNGLWFLKDKYETVSVPRSKDQQLVVEYIEDITDEAQLLLADEMAAFFDKKRKGKPREGDRCWI